MGRLLHFSDAANFAIHGMIAIAREEPGRRMSAQELATLLDVSEAHLGKVLQRLARFGFLRSRRGPGGGFEIERDPEKVTLLEIVEAIDGPVDAGGCLLGRPLCIGKRCAMGSTLHEVHRIVRDHLAGTKLSDLVNRQLHS